MKRRFRKVVKRRLHSLEAEGYCKTHIDPNLPLILVPNPTYNNPVPHACSLELESSTTYCYVAANGTPKGATSLQCF